jgi:hypothetical protein
MSPLSKDQGFFREEPSRGTDEAELLEFSPFSPTLNIVAGPVVAIYQGLTRTGIRMRVGERTDFRVKWPSQQGEVSDVKIGQWVIAAIPAEAVRFEAGEFRQGKSRWNRWIGRIVLVEPERTALLITAKLHGERWTLKSTGTVVGLSRRPQVWDTVNIVVDPAQVRIAVLDRTIVAQGNLFYLSDAMASLTN